MSAALLDHLWQSTLFAIGAGFLAWVLRKNGAHLRHAVWLVASIKFLVPFSWLTMLGQEMRSFAVIENARVFTALDTANVPAWLGTPGQAIAAEPSVVWV